MYLLNNIRKQLLNKVFGKNGTGKNGTNSKVARNGTFSILGFRVGLSIWGGGLGWEWEFEFEVKV